LFVACGDFSQRITLLHDLVLCAEYLLYIQMSHRVGAGRPPPSASLTSQFVPGSTVTLKPDDDWTVRDPGLVFVSQQGASSSVWLMKLPR
jgi:hypothetical protein